MPVGNTGPPGHPRGVAFVIILHIITLGIYGFYWYYVSFEEIKRHVGEGLGGLVALIMQIAGAFIVVTSLMLPFLLGHEIGRMYRNDGQEPPVSGWTGLWIVPFGILIIPIFVWFVKVQRALNRYWEAKGATA